MMSGLDRDASAGGLRPLRATLEQVGSVASNLRGAGRAGTLVFTLSRLGPQRVVCLGRPTAGVLDTLASLVGDGRIEIVEADAVAPTDVGGDHPAAPGPIDVLWVASDWPGPWSSDHAARLSALAEVARAVVVQELPFVEAEAWLELLHRADRPAIMLATVSLDGAVVSARPLAPGVSPSPEPGHAVARRWKRVSLRPSRSARRTRGHALIAAAHDPRRPPAWLVDLMASVGLDASASSWSLDAPGSYASQKVLIRLTSAHSEHLVKITRDARHGPRLRNEGAALRWLAGLGRLEGLRVPELVVEGPVGPVWAAVESLEPGIPMPDALRAGESSSLVQAAVDALIALGAASRREVLGRAYADPLSTLLERYAAVHQPAAATLKTLDGLLRRLADEPLVPVVAQHGDPGTWNLLAAPDRSVVLLDWEAFEPDGAPLWDLWHLLRSVALDLDRSFPPRRRLAVLEAAFLDGGGGSDRVDWATARYREAIPVAPGAIVPLFVFAWLHRAMKESSRLPAERVADGHYARFLLRILARVDGDGLRRLEAATSS